MKCEVKLAVLGAGRWGKNHLRVFHQLGVLAAAADPDDAVQSEIRHTYAGIKVTDDYLKILADPGIAAVVIAAPAAAHYELAKKSLTAGKDVLLEKPMALSTVEAAELVELAAKLNKILMVGHLLLYRPAVEKMVEWVRKKAIGELSYIEMRRLKLGRIRSEENVLWSFAPHDVAVLLALTGKRVVQVFAQGQAVTQPGIEDNVYLNVDFAGNIKAHIHISWLWPENERKTILVGTQGMIVYDEGKELLQLHRKGVEDSLTIYDEGIEEVGFNNEDALTREALDFLYCLKHRNSPVASGELGVEVVEVLARAAACLESGKKGDYVAHRSACIDQPAVIGAGTQIWHYSHVMTGSQVGKGCNIGQNVFIALGVKVGNNVKIQNNVSIYQGVTLEEGVFCGPSAVFTNVRNPRSLYPRNTPDHYQQTLVKKGASIGANVTILCGIVIGKYAFIGAGATVTRNVPDFALVFGTPAEVRGWICRCGEVILRKTNALLQCDICATEIFIGDQPSSS